MDTTVFGMAPGADLLFIPHEPGEELWLHLGFGPRTIPRLRITPNVKIANVKLVKTIEVDEVGYDCEQGKETEDFLRKTKFN